MNKTLRKGFVGLLIASILLMTFMPNITHAETGLTLEKAMNGLQGITAIL